MLAARARDVSGVARARWLALAAVAIGGTGIWLMHFMAMVGFDVPSTVVRYDVPKTVLSVVLAVVIVGLGLFIVGMGRPRVWKLLIGGPITGLGVAAMHYTGMAAMNMGGVVTYDRTKVILSIVIAVVAATVALWFALVIRAASAKVGAAALMGAAVCSMHYVGMSAIQVRLAPETAVIEGVSPLVLLLPISILACVVIAVLAYATVGFSTDRADDDVIAPATADGAPGATPNGIPGQRSGAPAGQFAGRLPTAAGLMTPRPGRDR
nr:MHYT domain-containing protein [Planosporangium mesophilum]